MRPIEEQGYVIVAVNTDTVDYVACAQQLVRSLRAHVPGARVCLITDQVIADSNFDHVRVLPSVNSNPLANDAQVFKLSPFRETVKLEADMLIASDISHWWTMFRHRDVVISTGCKNWRGDVQLGRVPKAH